MAMINFNSFRPIVQTDSSALAQIRVGLQTALSALPHSASNRSYRAAIYRVMPPSSACEGSLRGSNFLNF